MARDELERGDFKWPSDHQEIVELAEFFWDTYDLKQQQRAETDQPVNAVSDWIDWGGGECPVNGSTIEQIEDRTSDRETGRADKWDWKHDGTNTDLIRYRIHKGDASGRKDEDLGVTPRVEASPTKIHDSDYATNYEPVMPNGSCDCSARSRVSVATHDSGHILHEAVTQALVDSKEAPTQTERAMCILNSIRPYLHTTEPVSVPLTQCVEALRVKFGWHGDYDSQADITVLEAAGVKHVD